MIQKEEALYDDESFETDAQQLEDKSDKNIFLANLINPHTSSCQGVPTNPALGEIERTEGATYISRGEIIQHEAMIYVYILINTLVVSISLMKNGNLSFEEIAENKSPVDYRMASTTIRVNGYNDPASEDSDDQKCADYCSDYEPEDIHDEIVVQRYEPKTQDTTYPSTLCGITVSPKAPQKKSNKVSLNGPYKSFAADRILNEKRKLMTQEKPIHRGRTLLSVQKNTSDYSNIQPRPPNLRHTGSIAVPSPYSSSVKPYTMKTQSYRLLDSNKKDDVKIEKKVTRDLFTDRWHLRGVETSIKSKCYLNSLIQSPSPPSSEYKSQRPSPYTSSLSKKINASPISRKERTLYQLKAPELSNLRLARVLEKGSNKPSAFLTSPPIGSRPLKPPANHHR